MESFTDTQNVELLQYRAINTTIELIVPKLKIRQSVALLVSKWLAVDILIRQLLLPVSNVHEVTARFNLLLERVSV